MSEYDNLVVTIDTREKDTESNRKNGKTRMDVVKQFFEEAGSIVQVKKLDLCDYQIEGIFRDHDVNIGIEYKTLNGDFFPSIESDLRGKLFDAYKQYESVCLVVEEGCFDLKLIDNGSDGIIQNYAMQGASGLDGLGRYTAYKNFMERLSFNKIHARSIQNIEYFAVELCGLLKTITKPVHEDISTFEENQADIMQNILYRMPGIGIKSAIKGSKYFANIERFVNQQEFDLQMVFGKEKGKRLYKWIHDDSTQNQCAKNWDILLSKNVPSAKAKPTKLSAQEEDVTLEGQIIKHTLDCLTEHGEYPRDVDVIAYFMSKGNELPIIHKTINESKRITKYKANDLVLLSGHWEYPSETLGV